MSQSTGPTRVAAACENCGHIFAAEMTADGAIRPLGTGRECTCGASDFQRLD